MKDKIVAVTGAFGSLGRAVCKACSEQGARVVGIDRAPAPAEPGEAGLALALGGVDLASSEAAASAFESLASQMGGLDALVNVAGTFRWETVERGSIDTFDLLYQINLRTVVASSRAALPHLLARGGGAIVNIGAASAERPASSGLAAYTASKAGVAKFTEALADELKDRLVRVNAVLPSIIDTEPNRVDMPKADFSRWVQPEALADVIVFLLSDQARAVTGALVPVTGRT